MIRRLFRCSLWAILGVVFLFLAAALASAAINRGLPTQSQAVDRMTEADIARLEEANRLRRTFGAAVWPGWGQADIPLILYNERYAFLTGLDQPASGWVKVPQSETRGGAWELVESVTTEGRPVYRQPVAEADRVIGAFTVKVGERWVACLGTRQWSEVSFYRGFRQQVPPIVRQVFPYPLVWQLLMGEADRYLTALLHETFLAYQGQLQPQKLIEAENSARLEQSYPWEATQAAWQAELDALEQAARSTSRSKQIELARRFLQLRQERRASSGLSKEQIDYERQREWLEGLAKYTELSIGLAAANDPGYQPVESLARLDKDFKGYAEYKRFYQAQLAEVSRLSGRSEETRFYYGGMAQGVILDRLNPGWKALVMQEGVYIEDVLADTLPNVK
jgi:hypothetical protein